MPNDSAHVGIISCLPPTCHECGFLWKERMEYLRKDVKQLVETIKLSPTISDLVRDSLDQVLKRLER